MTATDSRARFQQSKPTLPNGSSQSTISNCFSKSACLSKLIPTRAINCLAGSLSKCWARKAPGSSPTSSHLSSGITEAAGSKIDLLLTSSMSRSSPSMMLSGNCFAIRYGSSPSLVKKRSVEIPSCLQRSIAQSTNASMTGATTLDATFARASSSIDTLVTADELLWRDCSLTSRATLAIFSRLQFSTARPRTNVSKRLRLPAKYGLVQIPCFVAIVPSLH